MGGRSSILHLVILMVLGWGVNEPVKRYYRHIPPVQLGGGIREKTKEIRLWSGSSILN